MPLYEYECERCSHRVEVIQKKFSDAPPEKCPKCGGPVHKLLSSPAIQFKGSGWYITDYAKKEAGASSKPEKDAPGDTKEAGSKPTDATSDAKSGAKPDTKSETKADRKPDAKAKGTQSKD